MFSALVGMLVLVANRACGDQLTLKIGFHSDLCLSLNTDDDLHTTLVEDIYCSAAHTAGDNDLCTVVCQKVGQEAGARAGIGNGIDCNDLVVGGVKDRVKTLGIFGK